MNLNALLEIIISLVALYWLMSTACSFFVEAINSLAINVRAKALERFVCEMVLGVDKVPQLLGSMNWFSRSNLDRTVGRGQAGSSALAGSLADPLGLFSHGLIQTLRKPQGLPSGTATAPSYIPSKVFAQALLDRLVTLSWSAAPALDSTQALLTRLAAPAGPQSSPWKAILADLQSATQPVSLAALAAALLRPLGALTVAQARQDLATLIQDLGSPGVLLAVRNGPAVPPGQHAPEVVVVHLLRILEAAAAALDSLPDGDKKGPHRFQNPRPLQAVIGTDALWLLALRKAGETATVETNVLEAVRRLLAAVPLPTSLQEALRPLLGQANFDADKLRAGVEAWYDATMERASGWFRRNVTWCLGGFGLVGAVLLNVNTIQVARDLAGDPVARHQGVALAEQLVAAQGSPAIAQQLYFKRAGDKFGWETCIKEAAETAGAPAGHPLAGTPKAAPATAAPAPASAAAAAPGACAWRPDSRPGMTPLFDHMRNLLITSGAYMGLVRRVETLALDMPLKPELRSSLQESLCTATIETQARAGQDGAAAANLIASQPAATRLKIWPACAWINRPGFAEAKTGADFAAAFWEAPEVVWHVGLSKALLELDRAGHALLLVADPSAPGARESQQKRLQLAWAGVTTEYKLAVEEAKRLTVHATALLDRLPFIGRPATWLSSPAGTPWSVMAFDVLGWLITAVMVSFGAPFWFDLMSKLVNKRATGPKPESTV